jgi:hypothetical protein
MMSVIERLRNGKGSDPENHWLLIKAADEIERLRTLVHHAFCEGQITSPRLDDWKNSEVYAALKEGE